MEAQNPPNWGVQSIARNAEMEAKRYPPGRTACRPKPANTHLMADAPNTHKG
ncbi:hypothetical protein [Fibrivirga algicola]|uniref:hypothetical protein n=1 Tax=Fibrivirga algicola TaxID=2950420 RepID=UPI001419D3C1|nr:hypothetical protein [Fibrivirga algicola]